MGLLPSFLGIHPHYSYVHLSKYRKSKGRIAGFLSDS